MIALLLACSSELAVTIDAPTIQAAVAEKFPIVGGNAELATLSLTDPVVTLPGERRIGLQVNAAAAWRDLSRLPPEEDAEGARDEEAGEAGGAEEAEPTSVAEATAASLVKLRGALNRAMLAPMAEGSGKAGLDGELTYAAGSFYLHNASLSQLEIDALDADMVETVRRVIQVPIRSALAEVPVYTLGDDLQQKAAQFVIKDVTAADDGLTITLGVP